MKLITETSFDLELNESKSKGMYVVGIFSSAELKNKNGRIYTKNLLERETNKYRAKIDNKSAFGELGHPINPEINPEKIAILIQKLEWKGNDLFGKAKVLDTPMGRIAATLIKEGKIGVSSRGLGTVNDDSYVNEDFQLLAYDLVTEPSNDPSWLNGIYEGKEFNIVETGIESVTPENPAVTNETIAVPKNKFKWHNFSESSASVSKVKKSDFSWTKNETVRLDGSADKIDKNMFRWGPDKNSVGSTISESSPYTASGGNLLAARTFFNYETISAVRKRPVAIEIAFRS